MNNNVSPEIFAAMQAGEPVGEYIKTVPSQVHVVVLNSFNGEPSAIILKGVPGTEDSIVRTWSLQEDLYLRRMNRRHFDSGFLKPYSPPAKEEKAELTIEQSEDSVLVALLNGPFKKLESVMNKTEAEAVLIRFISLARANEKSERIIKALETRLAEIQNIKLMGE